MYQQHKGSSYHEEKGILHKENSILLDDAKPDKVAV